MIFPATVEQRVAMMNNVIAPDIKAIKARLDSLERKVDSNHADVMAALARIERLPKQ